MTKKRNPNVEKESRNWLDVPYDVMIQVFLKLGVIEVLLSAQSVCSSWRKLSKDPQLFRYIDMRNVLDRFHLHQSEAVTKMALEAIDRSCGQLVEFSISHFDLHCILQHIAINSTSLKCLRLSHCSAFKEDIVRGAFKRLPALEEFVAHHCEFAFLLFSKEMFDVVGRFCPQLKSLEFTSQVYYHLIPAVHEDPNGVAFAIADNLPQLRRLNLFGNPLNNDGLQAILDKCTHLEYLDLRQCFAIDLNGYLQNKCKDIMRIRLPNDSTDDCEFDATIENFESDSDSSEQFDSGYSSFSDDDSEGGFPFL